MTTVAAQLEGPARALALGRRRSVRARDFRERIIFGSLILCGVFSIGTTAAIIGVLGWETIVFFTTTFGTGDAAIDVSFWEFITGGRWNPLLGAEKHFGVWPLICGTLMITAVAMSFALPLGLVTAIYLSEYAPMWLRNILKPLLEVIAGIPTVVFGFFALMVITPMLRLDFGWFRTEAGEPLNPLGIGTYNALAAGLAVGIMTLPIVSSLAEDALRAVPKSLREASYGLGATRFETSLRVVTPAAFSGIVAAFLLAIARCVGETMIVALAAGSTAQLSLDPRAETQPMTGYMVQVFLGDVSNFGPEYYSAYAVAATLFVMTLLLTLLGHRVRVRFRQVYE